MSTDAIEMSEIEEIEDVLGDKTRLELKLDALLETVPGAAARYHAVLLRFKKECEDDGQWPLPPKPPA